LHDAKADFNPAGGQPVARRARSCVPEPLRQYERLAQSLAGEVSLGVVPRCDGALYHRLQLVGEALLGRYEQLAAGLERLSQLSAG